ncbi:MAG: hypothetical protein ACI9OD_003674 [Limisphaerales bacterium]|jgi:hypothetical protein
MGQNTFSKAKTSSEFGFLESGIPAESKSLRTLSLADEISAWRIYPVAPDSFIGRHGAIRPQHIGHMTANRASSELSRALR